MPLLSSQFPPDLLAQLTDAGYLRRTTVPDTRTKSNFAADAALQSLAATLESTPDELRKQAAQLACGYRSSKRSLLLQVANKAKELELTPTLLAQVMDKLNIDYFLVTDALEFLDQLWVVIGAGSHLRCLYTTVVLARVADAWALHALENGEEIDSLRHAFALQGTNEALRIKYKLRWKLGSGDASTVSRGVLDHYLSFVRTEGEMQNLRRCGKKAEEEERVEEIMRKIEGY